MHAAWLTSKTECELATRVNRNLISQFVILTNSNCPVTQYISGLDQLDNTLVINVDGERAAGVKDRVMMTQVLEIEKKRQQMDDSGERNCTNEPISSFLV